MLQSARNPVAIAVLVILVCLLGLLSLWRLPIQLFPDIERPQMNVQVDWRSASPEEVESEILVPLENVLHGLPGVEEFTGTADTGTASAALQFAVGTDMKAALVEVLARINRLKPLPRDADRPVVSLGDDGSNGVLSVFFVQQLPGTSGSIHQQRRFIEDTVRARLEAIPGVAAVNVNAGPLDEVRISVDLTRAAALGIPLTDIANRAASANDISGGRLTVGRRQYTLRFTGRFRADELGTLVLTWRDGRPIRLSDVAKIEMQRPETQFFAYQNNNPAIGIRVLRASGANVLATLDAVKAAVAELRDGPLAARGLTMEQSFDASLFIRRAINLLTENLVLGTALALAVVWWFMRDLRVTVLIAAAIPVCLCATFIALSVLGRSLNVVSLAGLALAVGMVVEGAIVVSGNFVRLRENGIPVATAVREAPRQVAGALLASTATTIAVFAPVLFLKGVEGQLFGDLALTISIAVGISVVIALTLLPVAAGVAVAHAPNSSGFGHGWPRLSIWVLGVTDTRRKQIGWIGGLLVVPLAATWWLMPPVDYLPPVKRAAIDAYFAFPPGMSAETINREIAPTIISRLKPYMAGVAEPALKNYYLFISPGRGSLGARVRDESRITDLEVVVRTKVLAGLPDTKAFAVEGDLFEGIGGSARSIGIHLQSQDADALTHAALHGRELLEKALPHAAVQSFPNPDAYLLELRAEPDDRRIAEVGWDRPSVGTVVQIAGEGAWLGEHFDGLTRLPIVLRASPSLAPEQLADAPLYTPGGQVVRLGDLVRLSTAISPPLIRRVDNRRTVTLTIDPPASLSLEQALATIDSKVLPALKAELPADSTIKMAGSAADLTKTLSTMGEVFAIALAVLLLLMTALFQSVRDSLVVMLVVPLALVGGVLGLRAVNLVAFQALDLLSMIGFVMMVGVIVNHSILLVAAVRSAESDGTPLDVAIRIGLDQRLRAIVASTLTGALGALPMAVNPGPGSVIYRGLAAVNIGGVVVSLAFSLLLIPALLRLLATQDPRRRSAAAGAAVAHASGS